MNGEAIQSDKPQTILHICRREILRPIRDEILRLSGYSVESTCVVEEALTYFSRHSFTLVLIDVEGEKGISLAEALCEKIKKLHAAQIVAFVCNWRVALLTDCPDHVLRNEFDPAAFVSGVRDMLQPAS